MKYARAIKILLNRMVPIHWAMFSQSNTDWTAQVERLLHGGGTIGRVTRVSRSRGFFGNL